MKKQMTKKFGAMIAVALIMGTGCGGCGQDNNATENNATENNVENMVDNAKENTKPCEAGAVGCECSAEGTCDGEAVCDAGTCVGGTVSGLSISNEAARSCEILIEEKTSKVLGASYGEGIKGAWRRRAPNVAIAITQSADAALPVSTASLVLEGELSGVSVKEVRCFDAAGEVIAGVEATLN